MSANRTYPELGKANLVRCFAANGMDPYTVDLDAEYDDQLTPGENIALITERYGVETYRGFLAKIARWRGLSTA